MKAAYLAKSANLVDESNVKMMDEAGVASGKALFTQNCVACHGPEGQGAAVGPNLSDTYWLHGGSIQDVFKSIKYGWPDKGMRSWQEDAGLKAEKPIATMTIPGWKMIVARKQ